MKFYICALNLFILLRKFYLMRNRSAIWVFTILLFLACLYQLSFSWITKSFESDVRELAEIKYDSIANEAIDFVINDDTLIIGPDKEKQQIISYYEQKLLAEKADQPTYPVLDLDYQRCKAVSYTHLTLPTMYTV